MRLIDADAVLDLFTVQAPSMSYNKMFVAVASAPTIDPASLRPNWINVEEGLPFPDERVLVWLKANSAPYTQIDTDRIINGRRVRWRGCVSHWKPLPQPPKGAAHDS